MHLILDLIKDQLLNYQIFIDPHILHRTTPDPSTNHPVPMAKNNTYEKILYYHCHQHLQQK